MNTLLSGCSSVDGAWWMLPYNNTEVSFTMYISLFVVGTGLGLVASLYMSTQLNGWHSVLHGLADAVVPHLRISPISEQ